MKESSIKKINTAGLIGYIVSIILIVGAIASMVTIGIGTAGAIAVSKNDINVKVATNIKVNSTGNFLGKLNSFISLNEVEDLSTLTDSAKEGLKLNDSQISEISVQEENGGLNINAKTNEITISMKRITIVLILAFIFLGSVTVTLYMVKALMKSLKDCETPFAEDVIKNMTRFATSLVCVLVLSIVLGVFGSVLITGKFNINIKVESILLVAIIYILITVFKYGAALQRESDETL